MGGYRRARGTWEPAEELSLPAETDSIHLATLDPGDVMDAWPEEEPPLRVQPPLDQDRWMRMRPYCHADDPEPGIGDHGQRHLIQLRPAPATTPVHPALREEDRQARLLYAANRPDTFMNYTTELPLQS